MDLSVLLVNFNDRAHLGACLDSLLRETAGIESETLLADNRSEDGSLEFLARHYPDVRVLANPENLGFARANNQLWRISRGQHLLVLNTDTELQPGSLTRLLEELRRHPETAAVGPALYDGRGHFQVSFGRAIGFGAELLQKLVLNPYFRRRIPRLRRGRTVGWLSGACLLMRRQAFESGGGFDEEFFIYFEDIDLCTRVRRLGWDLRFVPAARVFHAGGATTAPRRTESRLHYRRSQLRYYRKHNSRLARRLLRLYLRLELPVLAPRLRAAMRDLLSVPEPRP